LRGNLDQVHVSGFSLVVFEVKADTLLDLIEVCSLYEVMHESLVGLFLKNGDVINQANDFLELAGCLIDAIL
jgi:hypothetical protein